MTRFTAPLGGVMLVFSTWAVAMGGLSSLQHSCYSSGIEVAATALAPGLPDAGLLSCMQVYRFFWFIICFEFILIIGSGIVLSSVLVNKARLSLLGLYAVAAILFINMTNTFYTALSLDYYREDDLLHRARTMVAGSLMTAIANLVMVVLLGYQPTEAVTYATPIRSATPTKISPKTPSEVNDV